MYGYKIKIGGLPQTVWACETIVDHYSWENRNSDEMLEIAVTKSDRRADIINGRECIFDKKYVLGCIAGSDKRAASGEVGKKVDITTVAVRISDLQIEKGELTKQDCCNQDVYLLPAYIDDLTTEEITGILSLLHKFIKYHSHHSAWGSAMSLSVFFDLLAQIDFRVRRSLDSRDEKMDNYYIRKIRHIVEEKYQEKLTEEMVAKELNLSSGYLSAMHKKETGLTFSEYLLQVRMTHAQEMLQAANLPTSKIAAACGFSDESYFRKKFKQFFGISIRDYRCIKLGMTLYHSKPTNEKYTTHTY